MTAGWFDRTFVFGAPVASAASVLERLRRTAGRLETAVAGLPPAVLVHRPAGKWSMLEHVGHLGDLEALWMRRLDDFDAGAAVLSPADLENHQTSEAGHNERQPIELVARFRVEREQFVARVAAMSAADLARRSTHPRLQQPMSVVDHCVFIAEHDDHHVSAAVGIAAALADAPLYALDLINTVDRVAPRLLAMDDERASARPAPDKWSPREIVGHLIDSASNNHARFVRGQFQEDLVFSGYDQDAWVAAQRYGEESWRDLVALWAAFNRHLAHVMRAAPPAVRTRAHTRHSLDRTAFRTVAAGEPATLGYVMEDYVLHLQHHLRQIPGAM